MLTLCKWGLVGVGNIINKVSFGLQMFRFITMFIPCFSVGKTHGWRHSQSDSTTTFKSKKN
jgi:hypothetical protein